MTDNRSMNQQESFEAATGEVAAKKPYQPPQVRHERIFEIAALICGKIQPTQSSCSHGNRSGS